MTSLRPCPRVEQQQSAASDPERLGLGGQPLMLMVPVPDARDRDGPLCQGKSAWMPATAAPRAHSCQGSGRTVSGHSAAALKQCAA